jgi:hypothetical protein
MEEGHLLTELKPILHSAASIIDNKTNDPTNPTKTISNNHNTLYFPWKYHPSQISTNTIKNYSSRLSKINHFKNSKLPSRGQNISAKSFAKLT